MSVGEEGRGSMLEVEGGSGVGMEGRSMRSSREERRETSCVFRVWRRVAWWRARERLRSWDEVVVVLMDWEFLRLDLGRLELELEERKVMDIVREVVDRILLEERLGRYYCNNLERRKVLTT